MEGKNEIVDSTYSKDTKGQGYRITNIIEIPILLVMLCISLQGIATSNLILYRTCVHSLNHTDAECKPFLSPDKAPGQGYLRELETEVQQYANVVNTVNSVLGAIVPAVLSLFIGVWSDKHGRKPVMKWSHLGITLNAIVIVLYASVPSLGPWWLVAINAVFSLSGGFGVMMIGSYCFITDVTDIENRSLRMVVSHMMISISLATGGMASPYLVRTVGTVYLFAIVAAIQTCTFAFLALVIKESLVGITKGSILTVFDLSHVKNLVKECFKKRPGHRSPIMFLTIASIALITFCANGGGGLLYLYTRNKLQWTMKDYTTFSSISTVWVLGGFLAVAMLQKMFRISDLTLAAVATVSVVVECCIKAAAWSTWHMYLGSGVSFIGSASGPMTRSFLTKELPGQDIGKAFGLLGFAESFCPLLSPLVYNALYGFTLTSFPGAFLVLSAGINFVVLIFILIVKFLVSRSPSVSIG